MTLHYFHIMLLITYCMVVYIKVARMDGGILLTCIQLLLLPFLHVIWSTPTNFAFFKKPLDKLGFLGFFQEDKTSAPDVFRCSFIPRTHSEKSSVMISFYGYEV